jgi:hypothetical protein
MPWQVADDRRGRVGAVGLVRGDPSDLASVGGSQVQDCPVRVARYTPDAGYLNGDAAPGRYLARSSDLAET